MVKKSDRADTDFQSKDLRRGQFRIIFVNFWRCRKLNYNVTQPGAGDVEDTTLGVSLLTTGETGPAHSFPVYVVCPEQSRQKIGVHFGPA